MTQYNNTPALVRSEFTQQERQKEEDDEQCPINQWRYFQHIQKASLSVLLLSLNMRDEARWIQKTVHLPCENPMTKIK